MDKEWIEWNGGERPVSGDTRVEVKLRDGSTVYQWAVPAATFNWIHLGRGSDIVAYKIVEKPGCIDCSRGVCDECAPSRCKPIDPPHSAPCGGEWGRCGATKPDVTDALLSSEVNATIKSTHLDTLLAAESTLLRMGYTYHGGNEWKPPIGKPRTFNAPFLLDAAAKHMRDRAATYDKPEGERSMGKTVEAFNTITGRDLRESEGWLLMALLKMVRSETRGDPHRDSIEDLIAYSALFGEARIEGK